MINILTKYLKWIEYNKLKNPKDLIECISDDIRRSAISRIKRDENLFNAFRCTYVYRCKFLDQIRKDKRQKIYTQVKNKILKFKPAITIPLYKNNTPATYIVTVNDFDIEPIDDTVFMVYLRVDIGIKISVKRLYYIDS